MAISSPEVFRTHDEYGAVIVHDSAELRILSFDGCVEQSCLAKSRPWRLHYAYTQAMMLGLLFQDNPQTAAVLGLGGGSLARTMLHFYPDCFVAAVELREKVVEIARDWFYLPKSKQLSVHVGHAEDWLKHHPGKQDLMFTDLFNLQGMDGTQIEADYLQECKSRLTPDGVLIANIWDSSQVDGEAARRSMDTVFGDDLLFLPVMGGNRIALGFASPVQVPSRRPFMQQAEQLGEEMGIPLARFARLLWSENPLLNTPDAAQQSEAQEKH